MRALVLVSLLAAGCPERSPRIDVVADAGPGGGQPDGQRGESDGRIAGPDASRVLPDAEMPPDSAVPIVGYGLMLDVGYAGGGDSGYPSAEFTDLDWQPPFGQCGGIVNTGLESAGASVDVSSSLGGSVSMAWDPTYYSYYTMDAIPMLYGEGSTFTASAPGGFVPAFQISGVTPATRLAGVSVPAQLAVGQDLAVSWQPGGASLFFVEIYDSTQQDAVYCVFPDSGAGTIPANLLGTLQSGSESVYAIQANDTREIVGGWDMELWIGTAAYVTTTIGP
jgi:hypothetical protein